MLDYSCPLGIFSRIGLLVMVCSTSASLSADCVKDLSGEVYCGAGRCIVDRQGKVWCSRHYEGGAEMTLDGLVLCGKGQCAKDKDDQVFCSSEIGGAVLIDIRGHLRCYGRCEPATAEECETTRADSAGSADG
jgi:hypothetical protein